MTQKDPYAEGYNQGFDDYKSGKPRKPHELKKLGKFLLMPSQDVERYVQAYHQGYEAAVRQARLQEESHIAGQGLGDPEARTKQRLSRLQSLRKKRRREGPDLER